MYFSYSKKFYRHFEYADHEHLLFFTIRVHFRNPRKYLNFVRILRKTKSIFQKENFFPQNFCKNGFSKINLTTVFLMIKKRDRDRRVTKFSQHPRISAERPPNVHERPH